MKRFKVLMLAIMALTFLSACAGPQPVTQYELGKVAAETILYQARIMQNQGKLSAETFNKILDIYDKLKAAQDLAINARKALLAYNTAENQNKAIAAMNSVLSLSSELISVATDYGLIKGGQ